MLVQKRNGSIEEFSAVKIQEALGKSINEVPNISEETKTDIKNEVLSNVMPEVTRIIEGMEEALGMDIIHVDEIHKKVEDTLMAHNCFEVAREYISYRERNKRSIFIPRAEYKPFEYPHLNTYVDAIQQSYWLFTEFDYSSDVHDFRTKLKPHQREAIRRSMLAISQVEVKVKDFWAKVGDVLPKPEIQEVGAVFAESEVRHSRTYAFLLDLLGLNEDFKALLEVPVFKKRFEYLSRSVRGVKTGDLHDYIEALLLFTLFVENVSLFSQFLIISTYNKELNVLSGMSNGIAATSLEENLHAMFGADLIKEIRKERPTEFSEEFKATVGILAKEAVEAESELVEWIFEEGEEEFLTKQEVMNYIKHRMNTGLIDCGFEELFEVDQEMLSKTEWFDLQINSTMHTDFFKKRSNTYTKRAEAYSADSIF